jgi:hypothetical protein
MEKALLRVLAYAQIVFVCGCIFFSTYSFFVGRFEQAFLPYPVLILIYLLFLRRTRSLNEGSGKLDSSSER